MILLKFSILFEIIASSTKFEASYVTRAPNGEFTCIVLKRSKFLQLLMFFSSELATPALLASIEDTKETESSPPKFTNESKV